MGLEEEASAGLVTQKRILVVDDEEGVRELVRGVLVWKGYEVVACDDPRKALEVAKQWKPGLIISDIRMNGMSGRELLEACDQDDQIKSTPFILMSGTDKPDDLKRAGWLQKPFGVEELCQQVADRLNGMSPPQI